MSYGIADYRSVDWGRPINWSHHLNWGLKLWWMCPPHQVGGSMIYDAVRQYQMPIAGHSLTTFWDKETPPGGWCCLNFDGSNDFGTFTYDGIDGYGRASFAFWAKIATNQTGRYLASFPHVSGGSNGCDIALTGVNSITTFIRTATATSDAGTFTYAATGWHRFLWTYDGAAQKLYVNGTEVCTQAKTGTITLTATDINWGRFGTFGAYAAAKMSDFKLWDRGFQPEEVVEEYIHARNYYDGVLRRPRFVGKAPSAAVPYRPVISSHEDNRVISLGSPVIRGAA